MAINNNAVIDVKTGSPPFNASVLDDAREIARAKIGYSLFNNPLSIQGRYEGSVLLPKALFAQTIPAPKMDPDTAAVFMMSLMSQVSESETKGMMQNIVSNMTNKDLLNKEIFKQMSDNIKKAAEIANQQKSKKLSDDIGLGFQVAAMVLGAVALSVFTAGITAPAIIGLALGAVMTMMSVADRVAEALDAKWTKSDGTEARLKISWEGMMERIMDDSTLIPQAIKDQGDAGIKKYKEDVTMAYSIGITIMLLGASLLAGFASVTGSVNKMADAVKKAADLGAKISVQLSARASQGMEISSSVAQVAEAASMVCSGGYGISIAFINFEMKEADNKKTSFFAMQDALNQLLDSNRDAIARSIETLGSAYATMSSVVSDVRDVATRSSSAISRS
jgi:hypothetical protein